MRKKEGNFLKNFDQPFSLPLSFPHVHPNENSERRFFHVDLRPWNMANGWTERTGFTKR